MLEPGATGAVEGGVATTAAGGLTTQRWSYNGGSGKNPLDSCGITRDGTPSTDVRVSGSLLPDDGASCATADAVAAATPLEQVKDDHAAAAERSSDAAAG